MKLACQLKTPRWSPYVVGAGIGALSWVTFALMGKALGTSTSMVQAAGAAEALVAPEHVENNAYFAKHIVSTADKANPIVDWQVALVLMLVVGAFIAHKLGREKRQPTVPALWEKRFGPSKIKRYTFAFIGGVILLFGARMAGGCTSGHGISGGLQLAVSSYVFLAGMLATGITTAFILFNQRKVSS